MMNVALYCSDHAHPAKNSVIYFKWMAVEMEEYYQQGDLERKLDFTVTPFFDRATCNPFKYQLGYIDVIALPLFDTFCEFMPDIRDLLIAEGLEPNRRLLQQKIDETKSMMADQSQQQASNSNQSKQQSEKEQEQPPKKDGDEIKDITSPRSNSKSQNKVAADLGPLDSNNDDKQTPSGKRVK